MSGKTPSKSENHLILAIEASGNASAAAIMRPDGKCFQDIHHAKHGHAERLIGQITSVLTQSETSLGDVTHIAAGCGPGSFTGMRVCLATAQGLLLASSAEAVGINGLAALAHTAMQHQTSSVPVLAVVDSRRRSVYAHLSGAATDITLSSPELDEAGLQSLCQSVPDLLIIGTLPEAWSERLPAGTLHDPKVLDAAMIADYAMHLLKTDAELPPLSPLYLAPPKLGPAQKPDS